MPAPITTSAHGRFWSRTPSITSFISVACGAGSSVLPNPKPLPSASTVRQTNTAEVRTPMSSAVCCRRGVAPSRKPVFRSWDVSPEIDAAIATTQPTVRAAALPIVSVQPNTRKIDAVPSNAAMVMPLVGLLVTPTSPTIRDATVTKKNANTTTQIAAAARMPTSPTAPNTCGTSTSTDAMMSTPMPTTRSGRSAPVLSTVAGLTSGPAVTCWVSCFEPMRKRRYSGRSGSRSGSVPCRG